MTEITKPILFAVEGNDEVNFFNAYIKYLGIENCDIIPVFGKDNFKNELSS